MRNKIETKRTETKRNLSKTKPTETKQNQNETYRNEAKSTKKRTDQNVKCTCFKSICIIYKAYLAYKLLHMKIKSNR